MLSDARNDPPRMYFTEYDIEQGSCRQAGKHGGWCYCQGPESAATCWAQFAKNWVPLAVAEYGISSKHCALLHFLQAAPLDCPAGCIGSVGNGGGVVTEYSGDGILDAVCMLPPPGSWNVELPPSSPLVSVVLSGPLSFWLSLWFSLVAT